MGDILTAGESFRGYRIEKLLGKGGLGAVYLVRHEGQDDYYALKVLYPDIARKCHEFVQRFVREAKIASKIHHPNLVQVIDAGHDETKGLYFLVMDYVSGCNLRTALALGGAMGQEEAIRIVASVASALAAGEPLGVVHRDIKPENIMLEEDGTVRLVDLGVAKANGTDSLVTIPHTVFGTPNYISPEQAQDASSVDFRADMYSLGIVLFELLCGCRPYEADNPKDVVGFLLSPEPVKDIRTVNPNIPAKLSLLIQMMCAKDPEKRLASASVLLDTLKRFGYCRDGIASLQASQTGSAVTKKVEKFDYAALGSAPARNTLSFETKDKEIQDFVQSLRARRRHRRNIVVFIAVTIVIAVLAIIVAIVR